MIPARFFQSCLPLVLLGCCGAAVAASEDPGGQAKAILDATGVQGGLIVHLGCGDGRLTAALRVKEGFVVHGLDTDPAKIQQARRNIQSLGACGPVSVEPFDGRRLPYADNLVNLLVAENLGEVPMAEVLRVLAPLGVAYVKQGAEWTKSKKPWPREIDEWTHFLHDASGNAVAHDRVVAAPRRLQWADGPLWTRSHEYDSSLSAMVSAQGRLFMIFDEGQTGIVDPRIPDQWSLIARDAFNGVVLWKRRISDWGWKAWRPNMAQIDWRRMPSYRCSLPLGVPRRLVAVGDRVYVTLGYGAPLAALDAATGRELRTYSGTEHTDEILHHDGRLVLCLRAGNDNSGEARTSAKRPAQPTSPAVLMAVDAQTGRQLWRTDPLPVTALSPAAHGRNVFCHAGGEVLSFDAASGRLRWRTRVGGPGVPLVVFGEVVMCAGGKQLVGLSAADGKQLWQLPAPQGFGIANPPDLFVADGLVWYGQEKGDPGRITGYDPATGKPGRTIEFGSLLTRGHHARCYRSRATDNYLLLPKRAVEFVDLHGDRHSRNNWVRGACRYGVLPCNGLLYSTPHPCFCYAGVKLGGFLALAPAQTSEVFETSEVLAGGKANESPRLERGPANTLISHPSSFIPHPEDWPAYRHDALRSGSVATVVSTPVGAAWTTTLGGKLTQPVVAGDKVFIARVDAGVVCCLDAASGKPLWDFVAGGRVDSSPTFYRGRVIFGSADGCVYCLRASDGALMWRFRAAPGDRRVVAFGQVESAWPVHGSVLLLGDAAYFVAGRSSFLDGGMILYGIDPVTGEKRHETRIDGPHADPSALDQAAYAMEGAKSDLLVSDGTRIYLFHNAFDAQLRKQPTPVLGEPGVRNLGERRFGEHLFSNAGFLDDSWFSRSHWMLGDHWTAFNFAQQAPKEGQLVVFDDAHAYAVKCFVRRNVLSPLFFPATDGYFLVSDARTTRATLVNPRGQGKYLTWLPQEGPLQKCWNLDVGFARAAPPEWMSNVAVRIRAMVLAGNTLFAAGPPDLCEPDDPLAALEGRRGAVLLAISAASGKELARCQLDGVPIFDGMSAARGRLYLSTVNGNVLCLGGAAR